MIAVPLKGTPGLTINRIRGASGDLKEYCEEFFDNIILPVDNMIGEENLGWGVAQRLLFHERNATANIGFGYMGGRKRGVRRSFVPQDAQAMAAAARRRGALDAVGSMIVDIYIESVVVPLTSARVMKGMRIGSHKGQWGSLGKLRSSVYAQSSVRCALAALGPDGVIWDGDEVQHDNVGTRWLECRGGTIAGGSNEMQRNIISERLLGLPREPDHFRDLPFSEMSRRARPR